MPYRIIGSSKYIIINIIIIKRFCYGRIFPACLWVRKMKRNQNIFIDTSYCRASCIEDLCHILPAGNAADRTCCFVSDLNHTHIYTRCNQFSKAFLCIGIYRICLLVQRIICPRLWRFLLCRICPEIRIMEVDQHLKSCIRCPFTHCDRRCQIIISSAITIPVRIIWIIPDTKSYIIDTTGFEKCKIFYISKFISVVIIIFYTAVL